MNDLKRLALVSLGLLSLGGVWLGVSHINAQVPSVGPLLAEPGGGDYEPEPAPAPAPDAVPVEALA